MDKILAVIIGLLVSSPFLSVGIMLHFMGEHQAAGEVMNVPDTIEDAKSEVAGGLVKAAAEVNEQRIEAVSKEENPYLRASIDMLFWLVIISFLAPILSLFGIK